MLYAISSNGERILASKKLKANTIDAVCPICSSPLILKCSERNLRISHFAHRNRNDCDLWHENETEWHKSWKMRFPVNSREVTITKDLDTHRADIFINGMVIELQHSYISPQEIEERENFYKNMIWIFDLQEVFKNQRIIFKKMYSNKNSYCFKFRFLHPRKNLAFVGKRSYWDISKNYIFQLGKMSKDSPCYGWGHIFHKQYFLYEMLGIKTPLNLV